MNHFHYTSHRAIVLGMLAMAFSLFALIIPANLRSAPVPVPMSDNSQDITVQIAGAPADEFPIDLTVNYQNGSQSASYTENTTPLPASEDEPLSFDGSLLRGIPGFGNVESATVFGVTVLRDRPAVQTQVNGLSVSIRIYYYQCCCYLEIRFSL